MFGDNTSKSKTATLTRFHQTAIAMLGRRGAIAPLMVGLALTLLTGGTAVATEFTFTKIADSDTPVPGSTGNFTSFNPPSSIDNGAATFFGVGRSLGPSLTPAEPTNMRTAYLASLPTLILLYLEVLAISLVLLLQY